MKTRILFLFLLKVCALVFDIFRFSKVFSESP